MAELPDVHPMPGLPERVTIYEVGPRDGLQAESEVVDTGTKIAFIAALRRAGLTAIEATSFVSPKWVPQLADAADVLEGTEPAPGVRYPVLVPNQRGLDRALAAGAAEVAVLASATDSFAQRNLSSTAEDALQTAETLARQAMEAGLPVRGYISMCFGDPWEGSVLPHHVASLARRLVDAGIRTISLGDTIGVATAGHVQAVLDELAAVGVGPDRIALHLHDTYGQALAGVLTALQYGITEFDASAGGIGGCPFAESATGNLATEDLVWMLTGLGIEHGTDLGQLLDISAWMARRLQRPAPSRVVAALGREPLADPLF